MNALDDRDVVGGFVRGESSWKVLEEFGARITFGPTGLHLEEPGNIPVDEASAVDVATGFIRHFGRDTLREWAAVMLATGMVDLSSLESDPRGDVVLEAIWDAAGGEPVRPDHLASMRELAEH
jgi:hypothetical protein